MMEIGISQTLVYYVTVSSKYHRTQKTMVTVRKVHIFIHHFIPAAAILNIGVQNPLNFADEFSCREAENGLNFGAFMAWMDSQSPT